MRRWIHIFLTTIIFLPTTQAAISVTGVTDKSIYSDSATFTITADPNAATTTATLDGNPTAIGTTTKITSVCFHELIVESRSATNTLVETKTIRFIVRNSTRGSTEDGIPTFTPYRMVNDAPSAFANGLLQIIAPAAWPAGLPIPLAAILRTPENDPLWLNGNVTFGGFPTTSLPLRRGWGCAIAPAATTGPISLQATTANLSDNPTITIEPSPAFTTVSGTISSNTTWPENSRIHVTSTLTINNGSTLTIGAGTIVTIFSGTATAGSAAEIVVNGSLVSNGTSDNPVVFTPDTSIGKWGGIEMPSATSNVTAHHTIFTGSGEDSTWFTSHSGYSSHRSEQALFLVSGSGTGTAIGAQLHLTDCYCFNLAGQVMNSKTNTWIDLNRTLMQRAITCGELNGSKLTIDRSALIEFPSEDSSFVDGDNDAIYLTNGDLSISNTVIGFTKDDGIDSGGNGGDNPFTAAADITPFVSTNNWFEGIYHEGNSLSGTRNVTHIGCVFINCGQGLEDGYSTSSTGDGPNAIADACLFAGNMVGARWGDNYTSYSYNGAMEVKNSFLLENIYHDAFSRCWNAGSTGWITQSTATNTFGHAYFSLHDNHLSQPDPINHPSNTTWNPATHGALIAPFMPVPGSAVGVAISSYAPTQADVSTFPTTFTVRLSTFSALPVSVQWSVIGKTSSNNTSETILASGTLNFAAGEMVKTITPAVTSPNNYSLLRMALTHPVNAEVTGEAWYSKPPAAITPTLIARASSGWRYRETRSDPPSNWKTLAFDDSSPAASEWLPCTLPAGFALGATVFSPAVTFGTTPGYGGNASDKTKTYYFRKKFTITDPSLVNSLTFTVRRDDAVAIWLNNDASATAVSADGTFTAPYSYATLAPNATSTSTYSTHTIPVSKLVAGENILAIELHQSSISSSDLLLDCDLTATFNAPLDLKLTSAGQQPVLLWFDSAATLEESSDLSHWSATPNATSPLPVLPNCPRKFFRLKK